MFKRLITISLLVISSILTAQETSTNYYEDFKQEVLSFDWKDTGTYNLPESHSNITVPPDYLAVLGTDARRFSFLLGNDADKSIEAIIIDDSFENMIYLEHYDVGYISLDDWDKINPQKLIAEISKNTEAANTDKRKRDIPELHIIGWLQKPTLDRNSNTVYWAIEIEEVGEDEHNFNSIAIRLGRHGYEKINWIGSISDFQPFGGELDIMLRAHAFKPGHCYTDFSEGDKIASYGIAALVAGTIGSKIAKAGGIVLLFKKFWGALFAGLAAGFYKIKRIFRKKQND